MYVRLIKPIVLSLFTGQNLVRHLSVPSTKDLVYLAQLTAAGRLRPVIARRDPLAEVPAALSQLEAGNVAGKLVVDVQ